MCGIIGILGLNSVSERLLEGLKRLEYRGYDSAGIATLEGMHLTRVRASGKLNQLAHALEKKPLTGHAGIGHTRWATHGAPTEQNAHPHVSGPVALVHNGIIENYLELRDELIAKGVRLSSDTDTEIVVADVAENLNSGLAATPLEAVVLTLNKLHGAFALAFLFEGHEDLLIVGRKGSPLALGFGEGEAYIGSDAIALSPFTDSIIYLEEGDYAEVHRTGAQIYDAHGQSVVRSTHAISHMHYAADKGNHRHFMHKEMWEQPETVSHTLADYIDMANTTVRFDETLCEVFTKIQRVVIVACGTAYYSGFVAKYWIEKLARIPVEVDIASEFRYRNAPIGAGDLAVFISQSGETADTLAAMRYARSEGARTLAVVNVAQSTLAREADNVLLTKAGIEVCVASTKAFTAQLVTLLCLSLAVARSRKTLTPQQEKQHVKELMSIPRLMLEVLEREDQIKPLAYDLSRVHSALYLGRGTNFPLAMEGALKLKELSYIHAEGYAFGELKHGPIALIDDSIAVVALAPCDHTFVKALSNMQEVAARDGRIVLFTDEAGADEAQSIPHIKIVILPQVAELIAPVIYSLPIQLLAYHTSVYMGKDVDQPRNLAKSVTVE